MGIFSRRKRKETRSTLANPSQWLTSIFSGGKAVSGISLTDESAFRFSAYLACIKIISSGVSTLPFITYARTKGGGKRRAFEHPTSELLLNSPNNYQSASDFRESLQGLALSTGNGYAEIVRRGDGRPESLHIISPGIVQGIQFVNGGKDTQYKLTNGKTIPGRDIIHLKGFSNGSLFGFTPIKYGKEAIGMAIAMEQYGAAFFGNGANPNGILVHPNKLTQEAQENLRASFERIHSGSSNANKMMILEEGLQYTQLSADAQKSQLTEQRRFQILEACRMFQVPPHKVAALENATFSNIEEQNIDFVVNTLRPWLVRWEQEINRKLFTPQERGLFFSEHLVDGLLRGNVAARQASYVAGIQNGYYSQNDVRKFENMNPVSGGDVYRIQINTEPLEVNANKQLLPDNKRTEETPEPTGIVKMDILGNYKGVLLDAMGRIVRMETKTIHKKGVEHYPKLRSKMVEILTPHFDHLNSVMEKNVDTNEFVDKYISENREHISNNIQLLETFDNDYVSDVVEEILSRYEDGINNIEEKQ